MNKFIARYNGEVVGTRRSPRPYKFAIIAQDDEAAERDAAYNYVPTQIDKANWQYHETRARMQPGDHYPGYNFTVNAKDVAEARKQIEHGWDGFIDRERNRRIGYFETKKAETGFRPFVAAWSLTHPNAVKAARKFRRVLEIVPVETSTN
jgi:hypothetical protein